MTFKSFLTLAIISALIACMMSQLFIDSTLTNVTSTLIIGLTTCATLAYLYWIDAYRKTPISALVIVGLLFTGLFGALLFQTLYWNPVVKYLYNPVLTFARLAFYLLIAITSHYIYLTIFHNNEYTTKTSSISPRGILAKLGLYTIPSVYTVWVLSFIGVFALIAAKLLPGTLGRAVLNLSFLMWFPFFIVFYIYKFGEEYASSRKQYMYITLFFILIAAMGIAFNSRGLIVSGLVNLFLMTLIVLLNNKQKFSFGFYIKFLSVLLIAFGLLKPFSEFSDAMLAARSDRGELTSLEMLANTIDIYLNSSTTELVNEEKYIENKIYSNYDEDYIENGILTRFVLTKFHDNAHYYASMLGDSGKAEVKTHVENKIIAILPQPLLDALGVQLNKMEIMNSTTDILVHETAGLRLGGLKVSSAFTDLEVIFGLFAPLVFLVMALLFFYVIELYIINHRIEGILISFPLFANVSDYVLFQLPIKSIQGIATLIGRNFLEDVLIYLLVTFAIGLVFTPFRYYTKN